jgi:hypothetical protein
VTKERTGLGDERYANTFHNASTPLGPDVPADLIRFLEAADAWLQSCRRRVNTGSGPLSVIEPTPAR